MMKKYSEGLLVIHEVDGRRISYTVPLDVIEMTEKEVQLVFQKAGSKDKHTVVIEFYLDEDGNLRARRKQQ